MDRKTAIKVIENEIRCVQSDCDRDCGKCELVLPAEDIVTAMTMAVNALMEQPLHCKDCRHIRDHDCPITWPKTEDDYCSYAED